MSGTTALYRKSARGSQALASRDPSLPPRLRSMLILVDGRRSTAELSRLGAALGDPQQAIAQLLEHGHIEAAPAGAAAAPAQQQPGGTEPARPGVPLAEAKRFAVRRITDLLGPTADDLCLRIEAARTAGDFLQAMKGAEKVLRDFSGAEAAQRFVRDLPAVRPA